LDKQDRILKMLEENKITAREAKELLDALGNNYFYQEKQNKEFKNKLERFSKSAQSITKDISEQIGKTYKFLEPKVAKATCCVFEKTADIMQDLSYKIKKNFDDCDCEDDFDDDLDGDLDDDDLDDFDNEDNEDNLEKDDSDSDEN